MIGPVSAVRVFVSDIDRARGFYEQTLGLSLRDPVAGALLFDGGGCTLIIEPCDRSDPETSDLVGRFTAISLEVPDIEAAYAALDERGVLFDGPPEPQDWGGRLVHFRDPDDNVLTLVQYP